MVILQRLPVAGRIVCLADFPDCLPPRAVGLQCYSSSSWMVDLHALNSFNLHTGGLRLRCQLVDFHHGSLLLTVMFSTTILHCKTADTKCQGRGRGEELSLRWLLQHLCVMVQD